MRRAVADGRERLRLWSEALGPDPGTERVCRGLAVMSVEHVGTHAARTVLDYELYVAGLRREALRAQSEEWIGLLRAALRRHLDDATADALTAAADGVVHQALLAPHPPGVGGAVPPGGRGSLTGSTWSRPPPGDLQARHDRRVHRSGIPTTGGGPAPPPAVMLDAPSPHRGGPP